MGGRSRALQGDRTGLGGVGISERQLQILGWIAITMYVPYVDQIRLNLTGNKGSIVQPSVAIVTCVLSVAYGFFRRTRDWRITLAKLPGVILGGVTPVTAL